MLRRSWIFFRGYRRVTYKNKAFHVSCYKYLKFFSLILTLTLKRCLPNQSGSKPNLEIILSYLRKNRNFGVTSIRKLYYLLFEIKLIINDNPLLIAYKH